MDMNDLTGCPDEARLAAERLSGSPASWRLVVGRRGGEAVWQVTGPGMDVALKTGPGPAAAVVARETAALEAMRSAGVPATAYGKTTHHGCTQGMAWLIRPWLAGPTTWEVFQPIRDGQPDSHERALNAAVDLCTSVGSMHWYGWVHGDLQPHHSLHTDGGPVQLIGCSWSWARDLPPSDVHVGGLAHLLSPELAAASVAAARPAITSQRDEVYALAAGLWWAATGQFPLDYQAAAIDPHAFAARVLRQMIADRRFKIATTDVWPAFTTVLRTVLTAEATRRPTAMQLAQQLRSIHGVV